MNEDLYEALKKRISGEVRFDTVSRFLYSTDASIYEIEPILETHVVLASGEGRVFKDMTFEAAAQLTGLEGRICDIVANNREEIDKRFPRIQRRVSGYNLDEFVRGSKFNLSKLVVGSE